MAKNGTINKTSFTDPTLTTSIKVKQVHIDELKNAITKLQTYVKNVDNCGNCSQSNCCQSCQTTTCQSCQTCQRKNCSNTCNCNCCCGTA